MPRLVIWHPNRVISLISSEVYIICHMIRIYNMPYHKDIIRIFFDTIAFGNFVLAWVPFSTLRCVKLLVLTGLSMFYYYYYYYVVFLLLLLLLLLFDCVKCIGLLFSDWALESDIRSRETFNTLPLHPNFPTDLDALKQLFDLNPHQPADSWFVSWRYLLYWLLNTRLPVSR